MNVKYNLSHAFRFDNCATAVWVSVRVTYEPTGIGIGIGIEFQDRVLDAVLRIELDNESNQEHYMAVALALEWFQWNTIQFRGYPVHTDTSHNARL